MHWSTSKQDEGIQCSANDNAMPKVYSGNVIGHSNYKLSSQQSIF